MPELRNRRVVLSRWACVSALTLAVLATRHPALAQTTRPAEPRERLSLDAGWRFHPGDVPMPTVTGQGMSYSNAKAGQSWGAAAPDYDDSDWRQLTVPHDWAVEGPFDPKANISQGYRPRGIGWYRRQFKVDPADRGRHLELQFDGIATHATIWFNGTIVHRNWCGYTSAYVDVTSLVQYGDAINTVAVRVDADAQEGWWYEGAGIYRHTWLVKRDAVHVVTDGVWADPVKGAGDDWTIPAEVTLDNAGKQPADAEVTVELIDPDGKPVVTGKATATTPLFTKTVVKVPLKASGPRLWSVDSPTLYRVRTTVRVGGRVTDEAATTCGFRTIRFDAKEGFFLNDKPLKLQGVCNHQDHAGVGVAVPDSLWEYRLRKLKELGVNANRCSHNPPSREFLEACDRIGILVMDENRNFNPTPDYLAQLQWMVRRDRNHPSVILWSVFNEEPMQGSEQGYEMVRRMSAAVKELDTTRPVTAAMNGGIDTPLNVSNAVDVVGFNYQIPLYARFHERRPDTPSTSSEDTSGFMTRGEYATDKKRHVASSYDDYNAPWGSNQLNGWKAIATKPYLAGGFVWTGFDYRGEPTPFDWPSVVSSFGLLDLCGFPKAAAYMRQAYWVKDKPVLWVIPHWNWDGREGKTVKVRVITNADTVSLSLNGKDLGEKPVDPFDFAWFDVAYTPGKLEAVAKKDGKEIARYAVETTGKPAKLRLTADRLSVHADGADAVPVTVEALDDAGRPVPTADAPVTFTVEGSGAIIGLGNGDPNSHDPEKGTADGFKRPLFNGLAQVILQSTAAAGPVTLRATSPGLADAEVTLDATAADPTPAVAVARPTQAVDRWRVSTAADARPDPNQTIADNDQNSWAPVRGRQLLPLTEGKFAMLRSVFTPRGDVRRGGGTLHFAGVSGAAEVWLDGKKVADKADAAAGPIDVPLPPIDGERTVTLLFKAGPNARIGLPAPVTILRPGETAKK